MPNSNQIQIMETKDFLHANSKLFHLLPNPDAYSDSTRFFNLFCDLSVKTNPTREPEYMKIKNRILQLHDQYLRFYETFEQPYLYRERNR